MRVSFQQPEMAGPGEPRIGNERALSEYRSSGAMLLSVAHPGKAAGSNVVFLRGAT